MNYLLSGVSDSGPPIPGLSCDLSLTCPHCGKVWGRIWSVGEWRGFTASCERCRPWPLSDSIPGSVLTVLGSQAIDLLPPAVLAREYALMCAQLDRRQNEADSSVGV